ncbi:MAG: hypothetical protein M0Q44_21770, partial [Methylobacter sp.]|nr:hypothetical protein [Methylobacter sp.]
MLLIHGTSLVFMPCDLIGGTPTFTVIVRHSSYLIAVFVLYEIPERGSFLCPAFYCPLTVICADMLFKLGGKFFKLPCKIFFFGHIDTALYFLIAHSTGFLA